jgi:hypothetical protein
LVNEVATCQEVTTKLALFVGENNASALASGDKRGGKTSRPAAGHEYITVHVRLVIEIGVRAYWRHSQASRSSDKVLVLSPESLWPHKGLVIKAGR